MVVSIHVRLRNTRLLGQVVTYFNSFEAWLVELSVIAITDANGTCMHAYIYETRQLMAEFFVGVSGALFVFL